MHGPPVDPTRVDRESGHEERTLHERQEPLRHGAVVRGHQERQRHRHEQGGEDGRARLVADEGWSGVAIAALGRVAGELVGVAHPTEPVWAVSAVDAPPKSRWRSAFPEAMPARVTGTDPVSEWEAGVAPAVLPVPAIVSSVMGTDRP